MLYECSVCGELTDEEYLLLTWGICDSCYHKQVTNRVGVNDG